MRIPELDELEDDVQGDRDSGDSATQTPVRRSARSGGSERGASGSRRRSRREEPAEDALPPMAIAASLGAAVAGALVWFLILWKFDYEIGWLAIGVGAAAGFGMVSLGGRGTVAAGVAAAFAGLAVIGGHVAGVNHILGNAIEEEVYSKDAQEQFKELRSYGREVAKMEHPLSAETVTEYAKEFGFEEPMEPAAITEFRAEMEEWELFAGKGGADLYQERARAQIREDLPMMQFLKDSFEITDLLFLALGIGAAFSFVMKQD